MKRNIVSVYGKRELLVQGGRFGGGGRGVIVPRGSSVAECSQDFPPLTWSMEGHVIMY